MEHNLIIANEIIIIALLLVAIIASMTLRHLKMPYTIGLVLIGYAFSEYIVPHIDALKPIGPYFPAVDIILYIFLPPLIFESAIAVNTRLLNRNLFPVLCLAIFGVIISAGIIGYMIAWYFAIPLLFALLFGALISSTDPVAVISIFKEVGVPKRLQILVEGESLLNDACSIIMFQLVLLLISHPLLKNDLSFFETSALFTSQLLTSFVGGVFIGVIGGLILRVILRKTPLHSHIHQTATLVAAYLTYLLGDEMGFSGVIAVVSCGFITARAVSDWIGPDRREELNHFWEYIGFLANSLIFLLVGITISSLQDLSLLIKGGILGVFFLIGAVLLARFVPIVGTFAIFNRFTRHKVPFSYQIVCFWGGLRGAVAIALVLSLPLSLPFRDLIIAFSVLTVLFSIFIQGMTIGPLIQYLELGQSRLLRTFHQVYGDLVTSRAAQSSLLKSDLAGIIDSAILDEYIRTYREKSQYTEQKVREFWQEVHQNPDRTSVIRLFWLEAIHYEQKQYRQLYDDGLILSPVYAELQYQTTIREDFIQSGNYHPPIRLYAPESRYGLWLYRFIRRIFPNSAMLKSYQNRIDIHLIFASVAVYVASSATIEYLERLSQWVCLDSAEITDIVDFYKKFEQKALSYLTSEHVVGSQNLSYVSGYLAERTAGAGMIHMLGHHIEEGIGDEKTLGHIIDRLIKEKNKAKKKVFQLCGDQIVP